MCGQINCYFKGWFHMWYSYYRVPEDTKNNFLNNEVPLQLNCTGVQEFTHRLAASAVRKDYYLFYLHNGEVLLQMPGVENPYMTTGSLIVFEKNCPFRYCTLYSPPTTHYFAHFTGYAAKDILHQAGIHTNTVYKLHSPESILPKFTAIFDTFLLRDELFDLDSAHHLMELLVAVGRSVMNSQMSGFHKKGRDLQQSLGFLHTNFTKPITVKQLADMEFMSESRYRALFHEKMNQSPQEYLIRLRMSMACDLLSNTILSISEIAQTVGYPDQRYFTRLFHKKFNISPKEYRKKSEK
ncbi:MAG: helix-turn-helix transcriptional regulator [Ruminococcaceae bacterium]|nr:helix-turn-helix transcriptional regulator [Oscillospiraceae bacterium]